jgi:hypothetical protein
MTDQLDETHAHPEWTFTRNMPYATYGMAMVTLNMQGARPFMIGGRSVFSEYNMVYMLIQQNGYCFSLLDYG